MKAPKTLVIFDIDGTLLFSNKIDSQCFADTFEKRYQQVFPTIDWTAYPHVVDTTIFSTVIQNLFGRIPDEQEVLEFQKDFVALIEAKRVAFPDDFREVPFARQCVAQLVRDERFVVGIGTGGWRRPAMVKLKHVGISQEGLHIACADGNISREDILQEAIDKAKAVSGFDRIVYIGDAIWDVQTTRNMDIPFIGLRRKGDHNVLLDAGAEVVIQDYKDYDGFLNLLATAKTPLMV